MNQQKANKILRYWDKQGKFIFTKHELRKLFSDDKPKAFDEGLRRLVKNNLLQRVC